MERCLFNPAALIRHRIRATSIKWTKTPSGASAPKHLEALLNFQIHHETASVLPPHTNSNGEAEGVTETIRPWGDRTPRSRGRSHVWGKEK